MEERNLGDGGLEVDRRQGGGGDSRSLSSDGVVSMVGDGECQPTGEMDGYGVNGFQATVGGDSVVCGMDAGVSAMDMKRKRGRPPRGQGKAQPPAKKQKEDEDVCFICFDGGSLVLCDRRSCPKAYHPACIKRDDSFFRSKAKWNCGWHICSACQKAAHYMCYTCTYSLCKGCTKDADYLCVRGDKGFCTTCMRTIMLIENKEERNQEMARVDFDDKSSWEYLFKVYWLYLKEKLSLDLAELSQAKNPWKEPGTVICKGQVPGVHGGSNNVNSSTPDRSSGQLEVNRSIERNCKESVKTLNEDTLSMIKPANDSPESLVGSTVWATKELLEFVAHMKNGDTSVLSQFDVQELLLEYIKRNSLRDPRLKSHILCDSRLKALFGKPRVGHFEMLKLLEYHFLIKQEPPKDVFIQGGVVDTNAVQELAEENIDNLMAKDKKRKTRKKSEERAPQTNLNEYAAIDVHNMNLIYLRRNLMENLIDDREKFHDNVVGSIVRIRISGGEQKHDMYRLVQVVGTKKASVPYKINKKMTNVILEVLNLDKKEAVSIDRISNQDFSEDECRRLRQSMKCGLVKCFLVGEIREKALALQSVRLNDWLGAEILRLNHLRDRASENGRKKELRECVEKLQLLSTPEEHERRLREIPDVHSDPNMDPDHESEEDAEQLDSQKQVQYIKPRYFGKREESKPISLRKKGDAGDSGSRSWSSSTPPYERRNMSAISYPNKEESAAEALQRLREGRDACKLNSWERPRNEVSCPGSGIGGLSNQAVGTSTAFSTVASEISTAHFSVGNTPSAYNSETKLWHYIDPSGKIQGPFCMLQLQKWSTTGYFPPDMRIWAGNRQDNSILLTDALKGLFHNVVPLPSDISSHSREVGDSKLHKLDVRWTTENASASTEGKQIDEHQHGNDARVNFNIKDELSRSDGWGSHSSGWTENASASRDRKQSDEHLLGNAVRVNFNIKDELSRSDGWGSRSSGWTAPVVSYVKEVTPVRFSQEQDSYRGSNSSYKQHASQSPSPSTMLVGRENATHLHDENNHEVEGRKSDDKENRSSSGTTGGKSSPGHIVDDNSQCFVGQSSGDYWRNSTTKFSSNTQQLNSSPSLVNSNVTPEQKGNSNVTDLHSPSRKTSDGNHNVEANENKESVSSSVFNKDSDFPDLPSPTPKTGIDYQKGLVNENRQSVSLNAPYQDSGPAWSNTSSLVVGGVQLADITDDWGGYSPTPVKRSVDEWDSSLLSLSSLKPAEGLCGHVTAATSSSEIVHFSPSHPTSHLSSWQTGVSEPIEFSTLADESVSDLLAEVDAMESRCGLASPTSVMNCG